MSWTAGKIVVPIDFSENCSRALARALELSAQPTDVYLVHVMPPLDAVSPGVALGDVTDAKREAAVRKSMDKFLAGEHRTGVHVEVRIGNPGLEIVDFADQIGADLIVIPTHGRHGVRRLMLGSVTERVLRHAHCSVLALRRSDAE